MEVLTEHSSGEIKRLQRCINDLVSLLALPAIWTGGDPSQVLHTLLDALMRMLSLDLVSVRLTNPVGEAPIEIVRIAQPRGPMPPEHEICEALSNSLGDNSRKWPPLLLKLMGEGEVSIVPLPLGLHGELGIIIAAAQRADFPQQTETLLLSLAASQAFIALQEARFRNQQKRIAEELDQRVAQRTAELAAADERWRSVFENSAIGVAICDLKGRFLAANSVLQRTLGYTEEELRNLSFYDITHEDDVETNRTFVEELLAGKRQQFQIEKQYRRKNGSLIWVHNNVSIVSGTERRFLMALSEDITERKHAEQALLASELNLRRVIDAIPTLAWCNLPEGPNEFLNKGWHDYTGLSPDESHGWGWQSAFHPDDLPPLMEKWAKMLISGEPDEIQARLRRHDGVYRWFLIRAQAFRDENGTIVRWYGTSTDIEDHKRGEEALRDREQSLRLILDGIAGLVAIMTATGEVEAVNRQAVDYFGRSVDEMKGWSTSDAVHPDDLPAVISAWSHSVETLSPYDVDHRLRRADGVYRWFHARGLPLRDLEGRVLRWYVLLTDIDDRRRTEQELQARERELGLIINTIPALAWSARPDGSAEFFNQHYLAYVGLPAKQLQGSGWAVAVHPDDLAVLLAAWQSMMASGKGGEVEGRLRRFDGKYRWFLFRTSPLRDEAGAIVKWFGTNTDIDDRKRAEEDLRIAQADLAHVTRVTTMGELTASIAHEINQPLSGIITNASTCLRMLAADPPQVEGARETARRTIRDGNRMSEVITRLRALFSKKELTTESVNLNEAAQEVLALSFAELQKNRIILRRELAHDLPLVTGDRVQLQQVILNLLRNGSDAMSAVEDRPRQLVIRTGPDEGDRVRLTVQDSGVGFDPQAVDRLFDPFYTTKGDGMGIGLSVSRSIIERHNGRLWATLNDGPGAAVSFSIPRAPDRLAHPVNGPDAL